MAHLILLLLTYTTLGGVVWNITFLHFHSKYLIGRNNANFLQSLISDNHFFINCDVYLYGGFVTISISTISLFRTDKKSSVNQYHLSIISLLYTLNHISTISLERCPSQQAHSRTLLEKVSKLNNNLTARGSVA